jgi:predicted metal-dependent peptidase
MKLKDFILEAKTPEGEELEVAMGQALLQIFTQGYLQKIKEHFKDDILIRKKDFKNNNAVAYVKGRTIYVNQPVFDKLPMKEKIKYLLHEFIHVMQNTTNKVVIKSFKEVYDLAEQIYPIIKKNLKKPISVFLTGKNQSLGTKQNLIKYELIPYLMNNKIRWDAITPEAKNEIIGEIRKSRIFNLNSAFWAERIRTKS